MHLLERDAALGELEIALESALQSQGRVALVSGEAGIGKTSLVERFARSRPSSCRVLWGGCDPLFTPRPLGPLLEIATHSGGALSDVLTTTPGRSEVFGSVLAELQRKPTLMVVEDVHWADDATLDVLRYVGRRIGRTSTLLVLTYRDDEIGAGHPLRTFLGDVASSTTTLRIQLPPLEKLSNVVDRE
jgi:predicted ATPase